jgi:hypothetical protein
MTKKSLRICHLFVVACLVAGTDTLLAKAQTHDPYETLQQRIQRLGAQHEESVRVRSLGLSAEKRDLWLVEVGRGSVQERQQRPAMLVVAGIEGNDLIGTDIALAWLEDLVKNHKTDKEIAALLETTTLYVIPRLNPDTIEGYFAPCRIETRVSRKGFDDDHDGLVDEDGPEDLNGDHMVTWMRVKDPAGDYILDPKDDRLLVKADPLKGQVGTWRYLQEGIDNDQDEQWNEDGPGGVNFNRNFPYSYAFFAANAGIHQVSETETRALADFIVAHPQIGLIVTYGAADNLVKTPETEAKPERRKPLSKIDEEDIGYYEKMGEMYRQALGLEKELEGHAEPGTFSDWMYFHRGRLSLAICPWSPALAVEMFKDEDKDEKPDASEASDNAESKDPEQEDPEKSSSDKKEDDTNQEERQWLAWYDKHASKAFVPWQSYDHPDFPEQGVVIGGYRPYALANPPAHLIADVTTKQKAFLTEAAQTLPRIHIRDTKVKHLGQSIFEVKFQVENTGFLPTVLAHGRRSRAVFPTRLVIDVTDIKLLSGERVQRLDALEGSGGMAEVRFVLHSPKQQPICFEVISMLAGRVTGTIELNQD